MSAESDRSLRIADLVDILRTTAPPVRSEGTAPRAAKSARGPDWLAVENGEGIPMTDEGTHAARELYMRTKEREKWAARRAKKRGAA